GGGQPRRVEQLDRGGDARRRRIAGEMPRQLVAQHERVLADRLPAVVRRRDQREFHRLVLAVQEGDVAPVARLLVRPYRAALLLQAVARGLEEAFQIPGGQRQQGPQAAEQTVRSQDPHERRERVRVVDREGRRVVQRIVEARRLRR